MTEKWVVSAKKADFEYLAEKFGIDKVIARIIRNRDVISDEEFAEYLSEPSEPPKMSGQMKDLEKAADIILEQISLGRKIRVIGDYDGDGVCATCILVKGISLCGGDVSYVIPHRVYDGYGMNDDMIRDAENDGIGCIVTCDNGISAEGPAELAKELGITLVITDHHAVPYDEVDGERVEKIPVAAAVVNPQQKDCPYPFKGICGAVVALRVVECLLEKAGKSPSEIPDIYEMAAIATITDIMVLRGENRTLVKYGLKSMKNTVNLGLSALIDNILPGREKFSGYDIGFILGPTINASGRVDTAEKAEELFLTEDPARANALAAELVELNTLRKSMTQEGIEAGLEIAAQYPEDKVLVIYQPGLHESIAGLVAGRIRENTCKPAIVITDSEGGAKGSGRSIEAYCMIDELTRVKDLLSKFGGHPMAAGLSLPKENIALLRERLLENSSLKDEDICRKISIDVPMPFYYVTERLISQLEVLEPFGNGNEKPVFALSGIEAKSARILGKNRNVLSITARHEGRLYTMVRFGEPDIFLDYYRKKFSPADVENMLEGRDNRILMDVTYYPQVNEFNGRRTIQFVISAYR